MPAWSWQSIWEVWQENCRHFPLAIYPAVECSKTEETALLRSTAHAQRHNTSWSLAQICQQLQVFSLLQRFAERWVWLKPLTVLEKSVERLTCHWLPWHWYWQSISPVLAQLQVLLLIAPARGVFSAWCKVLSKCYQQKWLGKWQQTFSVMLNPVRVRQHVQIKLAYLPKKKIIIILNYYKYKCYTKLQSSFKELF